MGGRVTLAENDQRPARNRDCRERRDGSDDVAEGRDPRRPRKTYSAPRRSVGAAVRSACPPVGSTVELVSDLGQERHDGSFSRSRRVARPRLTRFRITSSEVCRRWAICS